MAIRPRIVRTLASLDGADESDGSTVLTPLRQPEPGDDVATEPPGAASNDPNVEPDFDEATYLRAFPDIADAVRRGLLVSGLAHFRQSGEAERRLEKPEYRALLRADAAPAPPAVAIDTLTISPSGATLITGWSDDRFDALVEVDLPTHPGTRHNWVGFPRLARADVDRTLDAATGHRFGFLLVAAPVGERTTIDAGAANAPGFRFASGGETRLRRQPVVASDADLRDQALAALPMLAPGTQDPAALYAILDQHVGVQIVAINRLIVEQARARRMVERFGPSRGRYRGSIITSLRGGADQIVPRLTLLATGPGAEDHEFSIVVTDPDQFEPALRAARLATVSLDLPLTLVLQPGGDPAGSGEDAAADVARSDRLILMDQSVLPREPDWLARHSALLDGMPARQTKLFGSLLARPDGTLSHAGYYFDRETTFLPRRQDVPERIVSVRLKTISHPVARGVPEGRAVLGVPATFMSIDRGWFAALGGFTRNYCRAVYEDIDFCLRSLSRGVPPWIYPLPLWHFDRRPPLRAEPSKGGEILNNWLLHRQWDEIIVPDLLGLSPTLPA